MQFFGHRAEPSSSRHSVEHAEMDFVPSTPHLSYLDNLVRQFGRSLLNVSPSDIDRLKTAVENDDSETIAKLLRTQGMENSINQDEAESTVVELSQQSFFKIAVQKFKTEWIEFFMKRIIERSIPFSTAAQMIQENFKELWIDYRSLVEPILHKDMLLWDICTIQVPVETFTIGSNVGSRVGTCNSIEEWIHSTRERSSFKHWRELNEKDVNKVLKTGRGRKVNVKVKVYCFANICKTGIPGVSRFLLMRKASTSIFKTPLIKWIITYKWERIWRVRAFKSLAFYMMFFVLLHLFLFIKIVGYFSHHAWLRGKIFYGVVTAVLGLYFLSTLLCGTLFAAVVLLAWWKALYFAQAFKKTGIFALMIGRVLQECLPYFILLVGIMIGFGLTMHIIALDFFYYNDSCESLSDNGNVLEEDCKKAKESFGYALKSILTMVYSMLGMFDPHVLSHFHDASNIMIAFFVLYLAVQTIVMFNLLIATMGDAFDGVRATEEESFLMARAKLIDQYEASLYNKEIETMEGKIGKYLYVLIPEDKQLEKSVPFWKGRMTHIKEDVRKIVLDFQELITHNMNGMTQKTDHLAQNMNQLAQEMSQSTQNVDRLTQNIYQLSQQMSRLTQNTNEMFTILRDEIRNLEQRIQREET